MEKLELILETDRTIPIIDSILDEIKGFKLDLGCGKNCREGYIGIDKMKYKGIVQSDLDNQGTIPVESNAIMAIRGIHFLEHINDVIKLWNEIYRVCANGALLYFVVPHPCSPYYYQDPTHKSFYTEKTFEKYFDGKYVQQYSDYGFYGRIEPVSIFLYGRNFEHLSVHALLKVVK